MPALTIITVLTLAIGRGATAAIFLAGTRGAAASGEQAWARFPAEHR